MTQFEKLDLLLRECGGTDAMYLLHLRCDQAVFSHETYTE